MSPDKLVDPIPFEIDLITLDSDLEDDDGDLEESFISGDVTEEVIQSHIDRVEIPPSFFLPSSESTPERETCLNEPNQIELAEYDWAGVLLQVNMAVEFESQAKRPPSYGGDFLLIKRILLDSDNNVSLRGLLFQRNMFFGAALPHKRNEVCMCVEVDKSKAEPYWRQGLVTIGIETVMAVREVIITHLPFPELRQVDRFSSLEKFYQSGPLICRYIWFSVFDSTLPSSHLASRPKARQRVTEGIIRRALRRDSADCLEDADQYSMDEIPDDTSSVERRTAWRKSPKHWYSFGDAFCGAGGASSAARSANLDVMYGIDHWEDAYRSYRLNFENARAFHNGVEDLNTHTNMRDFNFHVDVLHLSPPCQYFSPAHTVEGQSDEANTAAIFVIESMLDRARPRIATVEETAGLFERHKHYFYQLLGSFITRDYSISFKLVNLSDYGLVQARKRIVVVASGPGIPLPFFPSPTHGEGRERPVVLADVLVPLKGRDVLLDIYRPMRRKSRPYDPQTHQLPGCLTTNGGGLVNVHPSGTRDFNLRELAQCQSFPPSHRFVGGATSIKKQIGNAVPPDAFKPFYDEARRTLSTFDWFLDGAVDQVRCSPFGEFAASSSAVRQHHRQGEHRFCTPSPRKNRAGLQRTESIDLSADEDLPSSPAGEDGDEVVGPLFSWSSSPTPSKGQVYSSPQRTSPVCKFGSGPVQPSAGRRSYFAVESDDEVAEVVVETKREYEIIDISD